MTIADFYSNLGHRDVGDVPVAITLHGDVGVGIVGEKLGATKNVRSYKSLMQSSSKLGPSCLIFLVV
jgi:hypothetical protein